MADWETHEEVTQTEVIVSRPCKACNGSGRKGGSNQACNLCKGKGGLLDRIPFERLAEAIKAHY